MYNLLFFSISLYRWKGDTVFRLTEIKSKIMIATEVTSVLKENRNQVIDFFNENCKDDKFYTLSWFMNRVLAEATASWSMRKNVGEKEILSILNKVMRIYPQLARGYVSNHQKAVNYFGAEKANQISETRWNV